MIYPMLLQPAIKSAIWGGNRLKDGWNKPFSNNNIAESWELSCHPQGCSIVANGIYKDKTLADVIISNVDFSGEKCKKFDFFPLLIKLIDAQDDLSVQVHPNDAYALEKEGQYGKTEMWYVLDAKDGAGVYCGFKSAMSKEDIYSALKKGTITEYLNFIPVQKGDSIFIPAGTVHAICGGLLIYEAQQSSSLTYRLYDYGRVDADGKQRQLHIDKAIDIIDGGAVCRKNEYVKEVGIAAKRLAQCEYFTVSEVDICDSYIFDVGQDTFLSITAVDGSGVILSEGNTYPICKGQTYFLPARLGRVEIKGHIKLLISSL
ncbi:MAG: class I mannose-6-phosphate isomerase [Clostridia bacterium]|nr:class I mannose-6-phosphate isomerase [Clostridia bacterium]